MPSRDHKKGNAPERLLWAFDQLAPDPDDRVLEIGCGSGVLLALICERLSAGRVTAMDRSAHAIALARRRNYQHISSGKAFLKVASFEGVDLGEQTFDRIVAVHVNLFWTNPGTGVQGLKEALSKGGALYLVYQGLPGARTDRIVPALERGLRAGGFRDIKMKSKNLTSGRAICVVAR